jgi:hypothetical protein
VQIIPPSFASARRSSSSARRKDGGSEFWRGSLFVRNDWQTTPESKFEGDDHRGFNRHGEAFDRGETFSGVDYETGLQVVEELRSLVPGGWTMAQFALRWILMFDAVTCAIPGAKRPAQVEDNVRAADLPQLSDEAMQAVDHVYKERIRPLVHQYW